MASQTLRYLSPIYILPIISLFIFMCLAIVYLTLPNYLYLDLRLWLFVTNLWPFKISHVFVFYFNLYNWINSFYIVFLSLSDWYFLCVLFLAFFTSFLQCDSQKTFNEFIGFEQRTSEFRSKCSTNCDAASASDTLSFELFVRFSFCCSFLSLFVSFSLLLSLDSLSIHCRL